MGKTSQEIIDKRNQLKKENKNICHGEICKKSGGVIKSIDEFIRDTCKECCKIREEKKKTKEPNKFNEQRKQLKKEGKNICKGEICTKSGGIIKPIYEFVDKTQICIDCYDRRELRKSLKEKGQNICYGELCNGKVYELCEFIFINCKKCTRYKQNELYHENGPRHRRKIVEYKTGQNCLHCGETDIRLLELDSSQKSFTIANSNSTPAIFEEIKKTQILCVECHRYKTYNTMDRTHDEKSMNI